MPYAVGDVTSVGTPKAGVFAEGQASVVAAAIIAAASRQTPSVEYDGRGQCYLEFGHHQVARVEVTFAPGQAPSGNFEAPRGTRRRERRVRNEPHSALVRLGVDGVLSSATQGLPEASVEHRPLTCESPRLPWRA